MRLANALDTTPDEFLVGTVHNRNSDWKNAADILRTFDSKKLSLAQNFLEWLASQDL